jgi:hypothetical protein
VKGLVQRLASRTISETCYWLCEWLCGHTARRTSCEKLNAAAAIAAVQVFDVTKLGGVREETLPNVIRHCLPAFTDAEWREVLSFAQDARTYIEDGLQRYPEWAHLRRKPIN